MEAGPTTTSSPRGLLGRAGARVGFTADGVDVTADDALVAARARGDWDAAVADCLAGIAAWEFLDDTARAAVEQAVPRREALLRRDRRLTSADDYVAWLAEWDLGVADCRGHLRRALARETCSTVVAAPSYDETDVAEALRAHVVVTGFLDRAQRALAEDVALVGMPSATSPDRDALLRAVVAEGSRARDRHPGADELGRIVADHAVDWTLLDALVVAAPDDDVARELIACVLVDGAPLDRVAEDAGLPVTTLRTFVQELEPALVPDLLGAQPGDLVGPVARGHERLVLALRDRVAPTLDDDLVRTRATVALLDRAITEGLAARVRWSTGG